MRIRFADENNEPHEDRKSADGRGGIPLLPHDVELMELTDDWQQLAKLLFFKGKDWEYEQEIRLLVKLQHTQRLAKRDPFDWPIQVISIPTEAVKEVYVGFDTPKEQVQRIRHIVGKGEARWYLRYIDWRAYRLETTSTFVEIRLDSRS